nr:MAG TPA: hypothetical protein [Caudoviricetes sp.]
MGAPGRRQYERNYRQGDLPGRGNGKEVGVYLHRAVQRAAG